ncbi:asparagine synthase-related protein [Alteromonas sp. a30]|uniref:asparagine synthase-related protein n=1 Tax=Alteromonas sp. a30 TaxID=2730917 RepID=UPI002280D4C2|nr:asparagine synthase-related protein [Alteromonas sp. a30]MCY7296707.1 hypothetical protein [Alteromonas sp. a30]
MSIIAGSVGFSYCTPHRSSDVVHPFRHAFDGFKHDHYREWNDHTITLSYWHRIISPESVSDMQPIDAHDLVLVADLRLDNRAALLGQLNGISDRSPDSEFVLAAYKKWGEDCVNYMLGGFAIAIWNKQTETLFCARDQVGNKPLYYADVHHATERTFIFCTSPTGILNHPKSSKDIDPEGVFNILMGNVCNEETATLFSGVKRLAAGFCLKVNKQGIKLWRYWEPKPGNPVRFANDNDYVDGFNEKLEQAIQACINTELPVSSFLSGGLDSSTVSCMAHKLLRCSDKRLITSSFVLPENEDGVDERPFIDEILQDNDFEHFYVTRENVSFRDCLTESFDKYGGFPYNSHVFLAKLLPNLHQRNVGVHLCGYGGDQVASYHSQWVLEQLLLEGRWATLWKQVNSIRRGNLGGAAKLLLRTLRNVAKMAMPSRRHWNQNWYANKVAQKMISPALANRPGYREKTLFAPSFDVQPFPRKATDIMKRFVQYDKTSVRLEELNSVFLPYGIEYRTPLLDTRLIEYCMSVPPEQLYLQRKRSLMRRATKGLIPENIRNGHNKHLGSLPNRFLSLWEEKQKLIDDLKNCSKMAEVSSLLDISGLEKHLAKSHVDENIKPKIYRNMELALYIAWFKNHFREADA